MACTNSGAKNPVIWAGPLLIPTKILANVGERSIWLTIKPQKHAPFIAMPNTKRTTALVDSSGPLFCNKMKIIAGINSPRN